MKKVLRNDGHVKQVVARDAHAPETVYVHTETDDRPVIERNKRIRSAGLMKIGQRIRAVDEQAEVAVSFQFPSQMAYQLVRAQEPDLFEQATKGGEDAIRAGERLALLFPEYVTSIKRPDRL